MDEILIPRFRRSGSAVWIALFVTMFWPLTIEPASADARTELAGVEAQVAAQFPSIKHMEPDALASLLASRQPIMIFDVREEGEYAVSHLSGAVRVEPGLDPTAFVADLGAAAQGKTIIFYCSVGMRSSHLASKSAPLLMASGVKSVNNLRGGIFRWSNEGRPLEIGSAPPGKASNSGVTVHPFNSKWGRLIEEPAQPSH